MSCKHCWNLPQQSLLLWVFLSHLRHFLATLQITHKSNENLRALQIFSLLTYVPNEPWEKEKVCKCRLLHQKIPNWQLLIKLQLGPIHSDVKHPIQWSLAEYQYQFSLQHSRINIRIGTALWTMPFGPFTEKASARALLLGYLYLAAWNCGLRKQNKTKKEHTQKKKRETPLPQIPTFLSGKVCLDRVQDAPFVCLCAFYRVQISLPWHPPLISSLSEFVILLHWDYLRGSMEEHPSWGRNTFHAPKSPPRSWWRHHLNDDNLCHCFSPIFPRSWCNRQSIRFFSPSPWLTELPTDGCCVAWELGGLSSTRNTLSPVSSARGLVIWL